MKKTIITTLAAAAILLSGCSQDETIGKNQDGLISFGTPFITHPTKAVDVTTSNLGKIYVHASLTQQDQNSVQVFDNTEVTKTDVEWTYSPTKYWFQGKYLFEAVNLKNGTESEPNDKFSFNPASQVSSTITFNNARYNGEQDLIYAKQEREVLAEDVTNQAVVDFTFSHLLAKVKFSFGHALGEGYTIKVTDIRMNDAIAVSTCTLGEEPAWAEPDAENLLALNFTSDDGSNSTGFKYIIPKTGYNVSFTVQVQDNGTTVFTKKYQPLDSELVFKAGYSYELKAEINKENLGTSPIRFNVTAVNTFISEESKDLSLL